MAIHTPPGTRKQAPPGPSLVRVIEQSAVSQAVSHDYWFRRWDRRAAAWFTLAFVVLNTVQFPFIFFSTRR